MVRLRHRMLLSCSLSSVRVVDGSKLLQLRVEAIASPSVSICFLQASISIPIPESATDSRPPSSLPSTLASPPDP
jgi:hypothetical protein